MRIAASPLPAGEMLSHSSGHQDGSRSGAATTGEQVYVAQMERWACGHADAVIANSAFTAGELARFHGVPRGDVHVICCGVDAARFETDSCLPDFRALFAGPDEKLVLYVGRLPARSSS
jgi:glycosyltransferase involved in cell wall biosynthesis